MTAQKTSASQKEESEVDRMEGMITEYASLILTYAVLGFGSGLVIAGTVYLFGKKGG